MSQRAMRRLKTSPIRTAPGSHCARNVAAIILNGAVIGLNHACDAVDFVGQKALEYHSISSGSPHYYETTALSVIGKQGRAIIPILQREKLRPRYRE